MRMLAALLLAVTFPQYEQVLRDHVRPPSVDYAALKDDRAPLDAAVAAFAGPSAAEERAWPRDERLAFWINAYNLFTLRVSRIFEWYGEDFVARFAPDRAGQPDRVERAVRAVVVKFGPPQAAALAREASARVRFLNYDWSLNDIR